MFLRIGHALPDHFEHDIGLFGEAALFPTQDPHEKTALDKAHEKVEEGPGPDQRVEYPFLLSLPEDIDHQGHHSRLGKGFISHPGFHRQGHEDYFAEAVVSFIVVELQPENLAKFFFEVLYALKVIDDAIRQFSHPDIDEGEDQPLLAAVMFVNGREADPGFFGDIANRSPVEIGIGKNFQHGLFKSFMDVAIQFI